MKDGLAIRSDQASDQGRMSRRDESFVPSSKFRVSLRAKGVACVSVRDGLLMSTQMSETVYNTCRQFPSAMGRNLFLVVALSFGSCYCDFLTARAGNARHKVKAFSILRHPQDPLLLFPVAKPSPFFRSPSQVVRIACFEYSFRLSVCPDQVSFN
jgi:hypothetical protein